MYRRPNENYIWKTEKEKKREKKNQISKRFSEIFSKLLDPDYYEGTIYGKYFNTINENGLSRIYVKDPMEEELNLFIKSKNNAIKYLVGFTGIGKTTLLRNYFKIYNRDIRFSDDTMIIYISFYYSNLSSDKPQKSVEDEVVSYFKRAIRKLLNEKVKISVPKKEFWEGLYNYIENNKPTILESEEFTPDSLFFDVENEKVINYEQKMEQLKYICDKKRLEYYSCMIKYILGYVNEIHNIVFIYDDIESKEYIYHRPLVEIARHIHSCFSAIKDVNSYVKTIVSLRAYTFRSNIDRQMEARRECIQNNTLKKMEAVKLQEIFLVRFNEIERLENIEKKVNVLKSYLEAKEQFFLVEKQINKVSSDFIYSLSNCNLCNAMIMYSSIMTNLEWISKNERDNNGSFRLAAENYRLTADVLFRAIACGNEKTYSNEKNDFFPNILYNHKEGTELLGLYIIKYMKRKNVIDLYGEKYIEGNKILDDILRIFIDRSDIRTETWQSKILYMLTYLYDNGILLRSIYDIEDISEEQIERKYKGSFKLYLSPRGQCLYDLLSKNALLLELYRDDIYTDIENNDKLTDNMTTDEIMEYLLKYIETLFQSEQKYIANANLNLKKYVEAFGNEFIVVPLIEGVVKNIKVYYADKVEVYYQLIEKVKKLLFLMQEYITMIDREYSIKFTISKYLSDIFLDV